MNFIYDVGANLLRSIISFVLIYLLAVAFVIFLKFIIGIDVPTVKIGILSILIGFVFYAYILHGFIWNKKA